MKNLMFVIMMRAVKNAKNSSFRKLGESGLFFHRLFAGFTPVILQKIHHLVPKRIFSPLTPVQKQPYILMK